MKIDQLLNQTMRYCKSTVRRTEEDHAMLFFEDFFYITNKRPFMTTIGEVVLKVHTIERVVGGYLALVSVSDQNDRTIKLSELERIEQIK